MAGSASLSPKASSSPSVAAESPASKAMRLLYEASEAETKGLALLQEARLLRREAATCLQSSHASAPASAAGASAAEAVGAAGDPKPRREHRRGKIDELEGKVRAKRMAVRALEGDLVNARESASQPGLDEPVRREPPATATADERRKLIRRYRIQHDRERHQWLVNELARLEVAAARVQGFRAGKLETVL